MGAGGAAPRHAGEPARAKPSQGNWAGWLPTDRLMYIARFYRESPISALDVVASEATEPIPYPISSFGGSRPRPLPIPLV